MRIYFQWNNEFDINTRKIGSNLLTDNTLSFLFVVGMNLVRLSSLAGLLLLSAFWEVPYFAALVHEKPPPTPHHGLIRSPHLLAGKTTCDRSKRRTVCWNKQNGH